MVFIHGAANDHSVFALQSRYFAITVATSWRRAARAWRGREGDALSSVEELIADWIGTFLDAVKVKDVALVGRSLGSLASWKRLRGFRTVFQRCTARNCGPWPVSDDLMSAAKSNDHVAYELINGWSYSAARQLGGNPFPACG